jgi:hypothetical protein
VRRNAAVPEPYVRLIRPAWSRFRPASGMNVDMTPVCLLDDHEVARRGLRSMDPSIKALILTSHDDDDALFARDLTEHERRMQAAVLASTLFARRTLTVAALRGAGKRTRA